MYGDDHSIWIKHVSCYDYEQVRFVSESFSPIITVGCEALWVLHGGDERVAVFPFLNAWQS